MKVISEMVSVKQKDETVLRKLHGMLEKGQYLSDNAVVARELGAAQFARLEARGREQAGGVV